MPWEWLEQFCMYMWFQWQSLLGCCLCILTWMAKKNPSPIFLILQTMEFFSWAMVWPELLRWGSKILPFLFYFFSHGFLFSFFVLASFLLTSSFMGLSCLVKLRPRKVLHFHLIAVKKSLFFSDSNHLLFYFLFLNIPFSFWAWEKKSDCCQEWVFVNWNLMDWFDAYAF